MALLLLPAPAVAASSGEVETLRWFLLGMELLGGLALFLFGLEQMASSLKVVAGDGIKLILARLTGNRLVGMLTGAVVTAVIQSSSVTTVMLVSFTSAGLMSLSQAMGVILGADIGTTVTAQIVAFKVTEYALVLVAAGFALSFIARRESVRHYGVLVMGLGLVFFGMAVMGEGMAPLRDYPPFIELMRQVESPWVGIAVATAFTALVQSSSAAMGVVIALAGQGLVSLEAGIALALGANIGTCVTAALASIGKTREAVRVAVAHVSFKVVGVLLVVPFILPFAALVRDISPVAPALGGLERLAAEAPRQIANAHTLFNVGLALLFLPLTERFAAFCRWLVPDAPVTAPPVVRPRYLDDALIDTPTLALDRARMEIAHLGERVGQMLAATLPALVAGNQESLRAVARMDDDVDLLHAEVIGYLGRISRKPLTDGQTRQLIDLMGSANDLENIGDIIETDLVALGQRRIATGVRISGPTTEVIRNLHEAVSQAVDGALLALGASDPGAAQQVVAMKPRINRLADSATLHQARRLVADEPNRVAAYRVEVDIIERLKRIYYFAKRMSRRCLPPAPASAAAAE